MRLKDLKILSKDTLIYGIGRSSTQAVQILLMPLYAAFLPADEFGVRALLMAVYGVLQIAGTLILEQALLADYYKVKTDLDRRKVVSTGFTLSIILSIFWGGLVYLTAHFLPRILEILGKDPSYGLWGMSLESTRYILRLFAVYVAFSPPVMLFLSYLRSTKRAIGYSIYTLGITLARVALMVVTLVVLKHGLKGLFEVDALLAVLAFPVLLVTVYVYSKGIKFSFSSLKSMLIYSLPLIPTALFGWLRNLGDRFFIDLFLTEREVGIFSFAQNFPKAINFLLIVPLGLAWAPYVFSIKDRPDLASIISRVLTYFLAVAGLALIVLGSAPYEILRLIARIPDYWEGAVYVPVMVLGMCVCGAVNVLGTIIAVKRKTVYFTVTALISAGLAVGCNLLLLPVIGLWAPAIAVLVSYTGMLAATVLLIRNLIRIPFEIKRILIAAIASTGITGALYWWHFNPVWLSMIVKLGGGLLLYLGILLVSGFLQPEEKNFIFTRLGMGKKTDKNEGRS